MPRRDLPLDGERVFVAHWSDEHPFAPSRTLPASTAKDVMAALSYPTSPRFPSFPTRPSRAAPGSLTRARRSAHPPARRPPSAAVQRRRAAAALVALAALGSLLGAGSLAGAGQAGGRASSSSAADPTTGVPVAAAVHVVQPGDTLWAVARRVQPEGDVRPLVARLRAEHGPGPLVPGQRLHIAV